MVARRVTALFVLLRRPRWWVAPIAGGALALCVAVQLTDFADHLGGWHSQR